ncbi:hypothetical protein F8M41_016989 [Gigaspora margarita]|uniref:Uncharacterized protein n=1 Tax=Gigaspora margarita TaxID=4874 RepID=A0A8H4EUL3_GIGMA|nr:hypothetical protein F8M41_016989 [Gigaspora margarita]
MDDLEHARQIPLINETISLLKNSSINESPANDVYLKIQYLRSILIIDKGMVKPSDELITKVKDALKHHDPYHELIELDRIVYLLYEIFDLSLRQEIESILGCNGQPNVKVLMKRTIPIKNSPFPIGKFSFVDSQIAWILIGIPAKVGYFNTSTRNINVSCSDSILVTSFKYPSLNSELSFIADILSYQDDKIKINVYNSISDDNNEFFDNQYTNIDLYGFEGISSYNEISKKNQELKCSIQWHILENLKSSSVDLSETLDHLDAIGKTIYSKNIFIKLVDIYNFETSKQDHSYIKFKFFPTDSINYIYQKISKEFSIENFFLIHKKGYKIIVSWDSLEDNTTYNYDENKNYDNYVLDLLETLNRDNVFDEE